MSYGGSDSSEVADARQQQISEICEKTKMRLEALGCQSVLILASFASSDCRTRTLSSCTGNIFAQAGLARAWLTRTEAYLASDD